MGVGPFVVFLSRDGDQWMVETLSDPARAFYPSGGAEGRVTDWSTYFEDPREARRWSTLAQGAGWSHMETWHRDPRGHRRSVVLVFRVNQGGTTAEVYVLDQTQDSLTGLSNRRAMEDVGRQILGVPGPGKAVFVIDLDRFGLANEALGPAEADGILALLAARIREAIPDALGLGRVEGDEFLVIVEATEGDAELRCRQILDAIGRPVDRGRPLRFSASIGVALSPIHGEDYESLERAAYLAMKRAKAAGRNTYQIAEDRPRHLPANYWELRSLLHRALEEDQFFLVYQPQYRLRDVKLVGLEALVRWNRPGFGVVPPGEFIPIAEDSGLIVPLGHWVLREACRTIHRLSEERTDVPRIAVNVSIAQFQRSDFVENVRQVLEETGVSPEFLELELTESVFLGQDRLALRAVSELRQLGVKLSLDDFGTGYSSLSYLQQIEVDKIKIDQSFVKHIEKRPSDQLLVKAIIKMAKSFQMTTIAEGVETPGALNTLRHLGCHEVQGYLTGRPGLLDDVLAAKVEF